MVGGGFRHCVCGVSLWLMRMVECLVLGSGGREGRWEMEMGMGRWVWVYLRRVQDLAPAAGEEGDCDL